MSVLNQTVVDFEFIIIDDGSDASTEVDLERFAASDPRIILHRSNVNLGLTRSLNIGLGIARGRYIVRQDADDVSISTRFSESIEFLNKNLEVAAVGTYAYLIGSKGEEIGIIKSNLEQLQKRNVLVHGSMVFRRKCLNQVKGYNEDMYLSQDYELFLRMVRFHAMRLEVIPRPLYMLRRHSESLSGRYLFRQFYFSVLAKTLTLKVSSLWIKKVCFLIIYVYDFVITHRLLIGSILPKSFKLINKS